MPAVVQRVIGAGRITVHAKKKVLVLPLGALTFVDGKLTVGEKWKAQEAAARPWLDYLVKKGRLRPGATIKSAAPAPAPTPAPPTPAPPTPAPPTPAPPTPTPP